MSTDNPNLTLTIRMSTAARFTIGSTTTTNITPSSTILQIKQIISQHETSGHCAVDRQRLIHKGRILSIDTQTLRQYGIIDSEQTLHLVKGSARPAPSPSTSTASTTNTNTTGTNATNNNNTPFNPMMMPNMMNNMMMNNNGNNSGNNGNPMMPNMDQMQQQLMSNPEMMSNIMNSPMMQSLTSNPDFMRSMIQSNPQMQQLLESNPELRHIMEDPELMRRSMEMMRDPSAMQNAMRNQDLALSQIENIPGGFSALRRMYEDVQEPMMDALSSSRSGQQSDNGNGTNNANRNSSGDNSGAAGTAMPNPWASTSSSTTTTTTQRPSMNNTNNSSGNNSNPFGSGNTNPWENLGASGGANSSNSNNNNSNMMGMGNMMPGMMPGMEGMMSNPPNMDQTLQMLENPMIQQMMNQLTSDPATMQAMMDGNPMLRQLRQSNPQLAAMMSNPDTIRSMMNPDNLRSMVNMQRTMGNMGTPGMSMPNNLGGSGSANANNLFQNMMSGTPPPMSASSGSNLNATPGLDFSSLLNQMQTASVSPTSNTNASANINSNAIPPEQRYSMQLQSLNDMGFDDNRVNIAALMQTHGNVNRAVDMLLTNPPAPIPDNTSTTTNNNVSTASTAISSPSTTNNASTSDVVPPASTTTPSTAEGNHDNGEEKVTDDDDGVEKDQVDKKND